VSVFTPINNTRQDDNAEYFHCVVMVREAEDINYPWKLSRNKQP